MPNGGAGLDTLSTYPTRALTKIAGVDSAGLVGLSPRTEINVLDYLSASQLTDVITFTGSVDVTSAISSAIAALPSTGGVLYFPAGRYKTTGGFTISVPCTVKGDGKPSLTQSAPTTGVTMITSSADNVDVFTFSAAATVRDLGIVDAAGTRTTGDAIVAYHATDILLRTDVLDCLTWGFTNGVNLRVSNTSRVLGCDIESSLGYGIIIDNENNADAGDCFVGFNGIYPGQSGKTATGAIKVRNGGCKIFNNAVVPNDGNVTYGIRADIRTGTVQLLIHGNKIERVDSEPVKITYTAGAITQLNYVNITGNVLVTDSATAAAIDADRIATFAIGDNILSGAGTNALNINNSAAGAISPNTKVGFTNNYNANALDNSTISYWDASPFYIGPRTTSGLALSNSSGSLTINKGDNSTATDVTAAKFYIQGSSSGRFAAVDTSFTLAYNSKTSGVAYCMNATGANYGTVSIDGSQLWSLSSSANGSTVSTKSLSWDGSSNIVLYPQASVTPANNGDMMFELTSNTQLKIKVKGSDGTVRSTSLTLA